MEPKFQSSFIPKKPVVDSPRALGPVTKNRNIFSVIATFMFIITLIAAGGAFGYKKYIEKNISDADKQLSEVRSAFEAGRIQELIDASARLNSIKSLLDNHFVVSQILLLLQNLTLKNIRFDSMSYQNIGGRPVITMDSEGASYNAIANQRDVFVESGMLDNVQFLGYNLTEKGTIKAKFSAVVTPKLISYKDFINSLSSNQ